MAALTESKEVAEKDGVIVAAPVLTATTIFRGALTCYDTNGFLIPAATGVGNVFAGVSEEEVTNDGASGDKYCRVKKTGNYLLEGAGFSQASVGASVYATDDQTISLTSTSNPIIGQIVEFVSATQVWVMLENNPAAAV